ncbi:TPA: conjugal transfer protein TraD [Stenotrophomonas maltophilia]
MARTREQQIEALAARLRRLQTQEAAAKRRADAHRKIKLGGIVIVAGLGETDPALLAGLLAAAKPALDDPAKAENLRARGAALLKR